MLGFPLSVTKYYLKYSPLWNYSRMYFVTTIAGFSLLCRSFTKTPYGTRDTSLRFYGFDRSKVHFSKPLVPQQERHPLTHMLPKNAGNFGRLTACLRLTGVLRVAHEQFDRYAVCSLVMELSEA